MRGGGTRGDDVGAHAVDVERRADFGDLAQGRVRQFHLRQQHPGVDDLAGEISLRRCPGLGKSGRVGVSRQSTADHLDPGLGVTAGGDVDGEPEPVQQLRTQLTFLRVHRADQDEPRRVADRDGIAFDVIAAHC